MTAKSEGEGEDEVEVEGEGEGEGKREVRGGRGGEYGGFETQRWPAKQRPCTQQLERWHYGIRLVRG